MRTLSADWMANTSKPESEFQSIQHGGDESRANFFYPRPVAPTAAQVSPCPSYVMHAVIVWFCMASAPDCLEHLYFLVLYIFATPM